MSQNIIRHEFDDLILNISKNVLNSTVNQTLKDTTNVLDEKLPEIQQLVNELKIASTELDNIKEDLANFTQTETVGKRISDIETAVMDLNKKMELIIVETQNARSNTKEGLIMINEQLENQIKNQNKFEYNLNQRLGNHIDTLHEVIHEKLHTLFIRIIIGGVILAILL